jgi:exopolysaccharide biosynthesis polyprenyl glycosylphosphotransferase
VSPSLLDVAGPRTTIRPTAGLTLLHVDHPQISGGRLVVKGLFDRLAAGAALVALAPVLLLLAVVIRISDRGPALFTQFRVGKDGRVFRIYKFRTMVVDAEQRRRQLATRGEDDGNGVLFKLRRDPRVTAVGVHLRRWSIDELPQLLNVFLGDMSLVGPRPALPDEAAKYAEHVRRRLVVKPGLTGLWQVNGRSDLSWDESVRLDLRYVENWSFALDLQILWKTAAALTRGEGAY